MFDGFLPHLGSHMFSPPANVVPLVCIESDPFIRSIIKDFLKVIITVYQRTSAAKNSTWRFTTIISFGDVHFELGFDCLITMRDS